MERFVAYLETIEEINRAERRLAKRNDATSLALLESALDAAKAAWLSLPAERRASLVPPPEREDYCSDWPIGSLSRRRGSCRPATEGRSGALNRAQRPPGRF
jgi:hypothetical protein